MNQTTVPSFWVRCKCKRRNGRELFVTYKYLFGTCLMLALLVMCWIHDTHVQTSGVDVHGRFYSDVPKHETLSWVVELETTAGSEDEVRLLADLVAKQMKLRNLGQVGKLFRHFLFAHEWHKPGFVWPGMNVREGVRNVTKWHENLQTARDWSKIKHSVERALDAHPLILRYEQQSAVRRVKRYEPSERRYKRDTFLFDTSNFNDPLFHKQWHLKNWINPGRDMNVTDVWAHNITGHGITVAVVDDGLDWQSPDIRPNYNPEGSIDIVSNDDDPSPSNLKDSNHHGTRCAGEIAAAANNSFCGVGLAWGARVSGIRLIDGPMTDEAEARAFTEKLSVNDVYSCSWGPEDDGKTLDGPHRLALKALRLGTEYGRNGYGSIYVVASGNGGRKGDNCNYDGYANSIYTVTVGAVDEYGTMPLYSEECASMLAVAYSSGSGYGRNVVTSDWSMYGGTGCTENHSGTSAAAPLASGIIALMLEARPCLTWRDVQYLIAVTAVKVDASNVLWTRNAAGLLHSHQHGFGVMDAWRLVNAAKVWEPLPWMTAFSSETHDTDLSIRSGDTISCNLNVSQSSLDLVGLKTLEYVHLIITLTHEERGRVEVRLICPSGTSSVLGATRELDKSKEGLKDWVFGTVRCWGEEGHGAWTVLVVDHGKPDASHISGHVVRWRLQLYGSSLLSSDVAIRIRSVEEASRRGLANSSSQSPCSPPPKKMKMERTISEKYLKMLTVIGVFAIFMALSDTIEYALCYGKEKEHTRLMGIVGLAHALMNQKITDQQGGTEAGTPLLPLAETSGFRANQRRDLAPVEVPNDQLDRRKDLRDLELDLTNNDGLGTPFLRSVESPTAASSRNDNHQSRSAIGNLKSFLSRFKIRLQPKETTNSRPVDHPNKNPQKCFPAEVPSYNYVSLNTFALNSDGDNDDGAIDYSLRGDDDDDDDDENERLLTNKS